jgi:hypothetical protein
MVLNLKLLSKNAMKLTNNSSPVSNNLPKIPLRRENGERRARSIVWDDEPDGSGTFARAAFSEQ